MNEDLSAFFGDLSVTASVVVGTSTSSAQVYFDSPSMMALGGLAVMDAPSVVARHSAGLIRGAGLTIGTDSFTVRVVERIDDGFLVRATLEAA